MTAEDISLEDLTPSSLAVSGNKNCLRCFNIRLLATEVIDGLPALENLDISQIVSRFAIYGASCDRIEEFPEANCEVGACSVDGRECKHAALLSLQPEDRQSTVKEIIRTN